MSIKCGIMKLYRGFAAYKLIRSKVIKQVCHFTHLFRLWRQVEKK